METKPDKQKVFSNSKHKQNIDVPMWVYHTKHDEKAMQDGLISSVLIGTFGSRPTQRGVRSRTVGRNTITNNESMTFTKSFICTADAGT